MAQSAAPPPDAAAPKDATAPTDTAPKDAVAPKDAPAGDVSAAADEPSDGGTEEGGEEVPVAPSAAPGTPTPGATSGSGTPAAPPGASDTAGSDDGAGGEGGAGEGGEEDMGGEFKLVPPKKGRAVIWGQVVDDRGEPLPEAQVTVLQTGQKVVSDFDGKFQIEVRPGTYSLRVFFEGPRLGLDGIVVVADQTLKVDTKVESRDLDVDTIEVETEANRATIEGEILARQRSAAVGDSVGRVEISKTPDKNAAQAAQRVVGATIVGNRFVYVRGLGERYSNALLNDSPLPSPEPDRAAVPLDLFPTMVIDSLTIAKTFTPDYPADFAGGSVRIQTRDLPDKFLFQVSGSAGFNTQATFTNRLSYEGGSRDWLGVDDGTRALPKDFPSYKLEPTVGNAGGGTPQVTQRDIDAASQRINTFMHTKREYTPPEQGLSVVIGDGWKLSSDRKVGVLGAFNYGRSYKVIEDREFREFVPGGRRAVIDYKLDSGTESVSWGAFGGASYAFSKNHKLTLIGIHSQLADDATQILNGYNESIDGQVNNTSLRFVERTLNFAQLRGQHTFPSLNKGELAWTGSISGARRSQPDTRGISFQQQAGATGWAYVEADDSGSHFWAYQNERALGAKADYSQPLGGRDSKVKVGTLLSQKDRTFRSRKLAFGGGSGFGCSGVDFDSCADDVLRGDQIGTNVLLKESTSPVDSYEGALGVYAGYLMAELGVLPGLRVVVGERIERTHQTVQPFDQFGTSPQVNEGKIRSTDLLPALSGSFEFSKKTKVRVSATRTLARPQLRELAPAAYSEVYGSRLTVGNPDLKLTYVSNLDARLEFFPTLREVLAASLFYKRFQDPIESTLLPAGNGYQNGFRNAQGANLVGVELEARKNLEFLTKDLQDITAIANLTLAASQIVLGGEDARVLTNADRPMAQQAPYVTNFALEYAHAGSTIRGLYNVSGARLVNVGTNGLADAYEHPRHRIDLVASQDLSRQVQLKVSAKDVLNSELLVTQGRSERSDNVVDRYTEGANYSISASYTY
ncbi:MAG: TonB-dependent receptor [Polyangiaceae bacterium]|nr:TonB-dependent receptor [Polyangiaceae bacterium]